ncbi:hypothetical protein BMF38_12970 [Comamonas kerstersii]|nr:hypothetical protein BMF38_12970 [Comamonas kerstersii]
MGGNAERTAAALHAYRNGGAKNDDEGNAAQRVAKAGFEQIDDFCDRHIGGQRQHNGHGKQRAKDAEFDFRREVDNGHDAQGHKK